MTGPNPNSQIRPLTGVIQEHVRALVETRDFYAAAQEAAGHRRAEEATEWAMFTNLYIRSQLLLIDNLTTKRRGRWSLVRIVKYAADHATAFETERSRDFGRTILGHKVLGNFSREEAMRDIQRLKLCNIKLSELGQQQPDRLGQYFTELAIQQGDAGDDGFVLPDYQDLDLAIETIFEIWLKYCELFLHQRYSLLATLPRSPSSGTYSAIFTDWPSTQFDPNAARGEPATYT
jgi:hypothetical protein